MSATGELLCCSDGAGAFENSGNGLRQDLEVEPQGPLVHVLKIQEHPLIERDSAAAVYLPEAGHAGLDAETATLPVFVESIEVANCKGRGPTRLMSPLRTLMSCGSSSMLVRRSHRPKGVTRGSFFILKTGPAAFVLPFKSRHELFSVGNHGAKFPDLETALVETDAVLQEKGPALVK